jgi:hypothetical protein
VSIIKRGKSGAVFFTLDTLIAGLIIVVTIMLVMSIYSSKPVVEDAYHELSNYINFVSRTTMQEVRDKYQFAYNNPYEEDLELYVYQKVYKLVLEDNLSAAEELVVNLTNFIVPMHLGFSYSIGEDFIIHEVNKDLLTNDFAKTSLTSRLLTFYINDSVGGNLFINTTVISLWT